MFVLLFSVHIAMAQTNSVTLKDGANAVVSTHNGIGDAYAAIPATLTQAYLIELGPTYNGSLEVFPISLTARAGTSSINNITIRPAAGNQHCDTLFGTVAGSTSGMFIFSGATDVTIDGRPGGTGTMMGLAIVNTNTSSTASPTIYLPGTARNNTVKYVYTRTSAITGAATKNISVNGTGINIENCFIYQCGLSGTAGGIYMNSASRNINIVNNKVVNCIRGIVSNGSDTVQVKGCEVYHTPAYSGQASAVGISPAFAGNWEISNNYIHDLKGSQVMYGIFMQSAPTANSILNIYNNMLALDVNMNAAGAFAYGIYLNYTVIAGHVPNVHHNTVRLSGPVLPGTANFIASACIAKGGVSDNWNCQNNIMVNQCSGGVGQHVGMSATTVSTNNIQDHNCYNIASGNLVRWGTTLYTNLATLTADVASCEIGSTTTPVTFVSATDLHLAGTAVGNQLLAGMLISVPDFYTGGFLNIATDFEGNMRAATPYMGADEASVPLPVSFLNIKAIKKNDAVLVSWSTASETNNDFFLVERSFDGLAFEVISSKIKGAGNSNSINTYSYKDQPEKTNVQVVYYRIRQLDLNGQASLSGVVRVNNDQLKAGSGFGMYPNPAKDLVIVDLNEARGVKNIEVFNLNGKKLYSTSTLNQTENLLLNDYAEGIYLVKVTTANGVITKRLVIGH